MLKFIYYIRYFFYIALNWNIRLAKFCIYHEIRGEDKYGINTVKLNDLHQLAVAGKNKQHAEIYQGANYFLLEDLFMQLQEMNVEDGFLDIGCGKGRAMVVAAHYGFKNITGIDFALELCNSATINCKRITEIFPSATWKVVHADAENFTPAAHVHVIFLFNPFKEVVMKRVIRNIGKSLNSFPRKVFVVYVNPQLKDLFTEKGFKEVYYIKKMQYVEASILESL